MSRHERQDLSGASDSTTLSEGIFRALRFEQQLEVQPEIEPETPDDVLRRTLSARSVVSTTSSFTQRMNRTRSQGHGQEEYSVIGMGSCGTVFELPGTELAIKKGGDVGAIYTDFQLTNDVHYAIRDTREILQNGFPTYTIPKAPKCKEFWMPESPNWAALERFPSSHRTIGAALKVERILPLPQPTREALIEKYFDESPVVQAEAKDDVSNKHCLVRLYLGAREEDPESCYESLQNFPLYLNMIEDLDLYTDGLAIEMAISLATIHWKAKINAMDSEFVLGSAAAKDDDERQVAAGDSSPRSRSLPHEVKSVNFTRRSTHIWVLDFDKASRIELTADDIIKKLVPAFLSNDR
ncbi:hypothetical protein MMC06_005813, partial [Schaereria dolodes]|nr:hypothetical protein [Schaereria dolodes]